MYVNREARRQKRRAKNRKHDDGRLKVDEQQSPREGDGTVNENGEPVEEGE